MPREKVIEVVLEWLAPTWRCAMIGLFQTLIVFTAFCLAASIDAGGRTLIAPMDLKTYLVTLSILWPLFVCTNALHVQWRKYVNDQTREALAHAQGIQDALENLRRSAKAMDYEIKTDQTGSVQQIEKLETPPPSKDEAPKE